MMRYQRVSPDLSPNRVASPSPSETKSLRGRSASDGPSTSTSPNHGEDLLLQWGHNKRTRGPRTAQAQAQDESSSSHKRQRRASNVAEQLMPPPQLPVGSCTRAGNLRSSASLPPNYRAVDEHRSRAGDKRPQTEKKSNNHHSEMNRKQHQPSDHDLTVSSNGNGGEKSLEHFEWPRIYISLSRKEKEDDFLAMKGTRLPQRPKKRAKNVDKTLQYVFPGMWLSDLTRGRYEVREKKCVKKKRRGLKGMENVDSDSE